MQDRKALPPRRRTSPRAASRLTGKSGASTVGRLCAAYTTAFVSEVLHRTSLDVLDLLITLTIASNGVRHLLDPLAARRAAPIGNEPWRNRSAHGISRNAISRVLNVPLETVRRRVGVLLQKNVIQERLDGLSVPETSPLGEIEQGGELLALNAKFVRQLFRNLKSLGVRLE